MKRIQMRACPRCQLGQLALNGKTKFCIACEGELPACEHANVDSSFDSFSIAREGKTALLIALQFSGLPDAMRGSILLSALVMPSTFIPLSLWAQGSLKSSSAMASMIGIFLVALLWLSPLRTLLSKRALRVVVRRIQQSCLMGQLQTTCPNCDQSLASPAFDAAFQCPGCQEELLSSDGVIVSRIERESNRVAAWTLRAKALVDADRNARQPTYLRDKLISKLVIAANIVLPILAILTFIFVDQPKG